MAVMVIAVTVDAMDVIIHYRAVLRNLASHRIKNVVENAMALMGLRPRINFDELNDLRDMIVPLKSGNKSHRRKGLLCNPGFQGDKLAYGEIASGT